MAFYLGIPFNGFQKTLSKNQELKETIMLRAFARITRFIRDYHYYRGRGLNSKAAWHFASMTLP